jgi:hypothetical protein
MDRMAYSSAGLDGLFSAARGASSATADGKIRVTVDGDGIVSAVDLDPRAMRFDSQTLAEHLLKAMQDAQLTILRQTAAGAEDNGGMSKRLDDLHDDFLRQMSAHENAMTDVIRRMEA